MQWLISERLAGIFSGDAWQTGSLGFMVSAANTESAEVFAIWNMHFKLYCTNRDVLKPLIHRLTDLAKQERLATALREQVSLGHLTTDQLGVGLKFVAPSTCSVSIAKVLLDCGAVVDFMTSKSRKDTWGKLH